MYITPIGHLRRRIITYRPLHSTFFKSTRLFHACLALNAAYDMPQAPKVTKTEALPADEAKWIEFHKIHWTDQVGKERIWEAAARKTRGKSGVDGAPNNHNSCN